MNDPIRDTIAALATAPGRGAIAIVRVSGPAALSIAQKITGIAPRPRSAVVADFADAVGEAFDQGLVIAFPGPNSYTGEDLVEFQCHGGTVVSDVLLEACYALGARAAEPGEFTLRAFLNDKLDLAQAEAVADLVASDSRLQARAALRSLSGRFSDAVGVLQDELTGVRVELEAHLDFPDEEIGPETGASLRRRLDGLGDALTALQANAEQGAVLNDGLSIVIAGPPNAGKSSLLNRLAGYDAAIVTDLPGTTRDPLRERLVLDGLPVNVIDTAGLRESSDPIEGEGVRRAERELARADHVLWVVDIRDPVAPAVEAALRQLAEDASWVLVRNKRDLVDGAELEPDPDSAVTLRLSALTGEGLESLVGNLKAAAGWSDAITGTFSVRRRHLDALGRADAHLAEAAARLLDAPELAAEELRGTQQALGELTGELTSDDLLGEIFSRFCIGK